MNKHYLAALCAAAIAWLAADGVEAEESEVNAVIEHEKDSLTGNWDDDLKAMYQACCRCIVEDDDQPEEEEEEEATPLEVVQKEKTRVEDKIDEIVATLKIGYNFIPGIGAGWCRNEEDLEKMRDFVRGALTAKAMMSPSPCDCCDCGYEE